MVSAVEKDTMLSVAESLHDFALNMSQDALIHHGVLACEDYKIKISRCEGCTKLHFQRMYFMLRMSWRSGTTDTVSAWKMAVKVYSREV